MALHMVRVRADHDLDLRIEGSKGIHKIIAREEEVFVRRMVHMRLIPEGAWSFDYLIIEGDMGLRVRQIARIPAPGTDESVPQGVDLRFDGIYIFVEGSGAGVLLHLPEGLQGIRRLFLHLLPPFPGGLGEAFAAVRTQLIRIHDTAADARPVINEHIPAVRTGLTVDLRPVPVQIQGDEAYRLPHPLEIDGAMPKIRGHPDDRRL